jgi:hypothetical protein
MILMQLVYIAVTHAFAPAPFGDMTSRPCRTDTSIHWVLLMAGFRLAATKRINELGRMPSGDNTSCHAGSGLSTENGRHEAIQGSRSHPARIPQARASY